MRKSVYRLSGKIGLLLWLLFACLLGKAQMNDLKFDHLTSENGLPQNTIHGVVKDKYGFIWFGTWSGLCRYDGYRVKVYRHQPGDPKSLINNRIHSLCKDADGNIWVLTFQGDYAGKYDYEHDDFVNIAKKQTPPAVNKMLNRIGHYDRAVFTSGNYKWRMDSASHTLLETYKPSGNEYKVTPNPSNRWALNDTYICELYLDSDRMLWVGTYSNGINKANLSAKPFHYHFHDPANSNSIVDNNVRALCMDKDGNLWLGARDMGVSVVHPNGKVTKFKARSEGGELTDSQIRGIFTDSKGNVWIGTKTGLDRYDRASKTFKHFGNTQIGNATVVSIAEDHLHQIWLATWRGVFKYTYDNDALVHFDLGKSIADNWSYCILEDADHNLWIGTEGRGLLMCNPTPDGRLNIKTIYNHNEQDSTSVSNDRIYYIFQDSRHMIWIGTGDGLDRYNAQKHSFEHYSVLRSGLPHSAVSSITEDNAGNLWIGHKQGISKISRNMSIVNYTGQDGLQGNEFADGAVYNCPKTDRMYFGGTNGYNDFAPDSILADTRVPKVMLTELKVLSKPVHVNEVVNDEVLLHKPIYLTDEITLGHNDKGVSIEFAALDFVNPAGNKYAYKLEGADKAWVYTDASQRIASYPDLQPGNYIFKVMAANADGVWNREPKTLRITVLPPWWASNWAYSVYIIILIITAFILGRHAIDHIKLREKLSYEQKLHEKDLELTQSKIDFFTNISHEIKTPLSLILAPISQLMAGDRDKESVDAQLKTMKANGERLHKLINQLLDIRRLETGNTPLNLQSGDLGEFLTRLAGYFQQMAEAKEINLKVIVGEGYLQQQFDHDKLEKVIDNLLSNAFKYTKPGGLISLAVKEAGEGQTKWIVIEVSDNGIGIPPADLKRIFEPFQQADNKQGGGSGLGLAFSKSLVELHGGSIDVMSDALSDNEHETRFTVKLPSRPATDGANLQPSAQEKRLAQPIIAAQADLNAVPLTKAARLDKKPVLLIVEDNPDLRAYLKQLFTVDFTTLEAEGGIEGSAMAAQHLPDLIITDMMMPDGNGLDLCRAVKNEPATKHIPVIMLTARSITEHQVEGLNAGADDYIAKPFDPQALLLKVRKIIISRRTLRDKYQSTITVAPPVEFDPVSPEDALLKKLTGFIEANMADPDLDNEKVSQAIGISRPQLYRKIKALTGLSVIDIIKETRLAQAKQMLAERKYNVNEVAYKVGFTDADYFGKCFKQKWGVSPSEYLKTAQSKPIDRVGEA